MARAVLVSAAAIFNSEGQVLLAKRPEGVDYAGYWELPGGKLAPYETGLQALKREIYEELDIKVVQARPLIRNSHEAFGKKLLLDVWKVNQFTGKPWGKEGQVLRWVNIEDLTNYTFPPANKPVATAVELSDEYIILNQNTNTTQQGISFLEQQTILKGLFVQLNLTNWNADTSLSLAKEYARFCQTQDVNLLINVPPEDTAAYPMHLVEQLGVAGVHLYAEDLIKYTERPLSIDKWLVVSCANLEQVLQAEQLGADFVLIDLEQLGGAIFNQITEASPLPVYAQVKTAQPCSSLRIYGLGGQGPALSINC